MGCEEGWGDGSRESGAQGEGEVWVESCYAGEVGGYSGEGVGESVGANTHSRNKLKSVSVSMIIRFTLWQLHMSVFLSGPGVNE